MKKEEKEESKVCECGNDCKCKSSRKGSTVSVVIIVLLLVALVCCIFMLTQKDDKETNDNNNENNEVVNDNKNNNKNNDGVEIYGLGDGFKALDEAALVSASIIDSYSLKYDLDNDSEKEDISINYENWDLTVKIDDKTFAIDVQAHDIYMYIVDLLDNDNKVDVMITTNLSNDMTYYLLNYENGKVEEIKQGVTSPYVNGKGKLVLLNEVEDAVSPKITNNYFEISSSKEVKELKNDVSSLKNKELVLTGDYQLPYTYTRDVENIIQTSYDQIQYLNNLEDSSKETKIEFIEFLSEDENILHGKLDGKDVYIFPVGGYLAG